MTTAAFDIKKTLTAYAELEVVKKEIKMAEVYLSALGNSIREDQRAIADLIYLRRADCKKRDFRRLSEVIRGQGRLDTELVDVGTPKNNGSSHPTHLTQGNGNNGLSLNNYLRLQLLQASTSNILNKMGEGGRTLSQPEGFRRDYWGGSNIIYDRSSQTWMVP